MFAARPANSTVLESLTSLWSIQRLSCRCRRATPRCAKCPRGRATRTRTNVGSATGVPSRTGCLNVPVRTGNARFRPCNDCACRSAPGGRYAQPLERRVEPEVCAPAACATTAEKWRATCLLSPRGPFAGLVSKTLLGQWLGSAVWRKTKQRRRKAASIFAQSARKLSVSRVAGLGPCAVAGLRHRYRARRYPTPSSVSRMRGRVGSTSIFLRRLRTTMRR